MKTTKLFLLPLALLILSGCRKEPPQTEILYDNWGVPHIYAASDAEMYRAVGYTQMENHADLILRLYAVSRGKASEYWGPSFLPSDIAVWKSRVPDIAGEWTAAQDPVVLGWLNAYVSGMNEFAEKFPGQIADSLKRVLPVKAEDVMAHTYRTVYLTFVAGGAVRKVRSWKQDGEYGSNAWAIGPSRSGSGNAMLLINPHLPWQDLYTWFEMHLNKPGWQFYGAGFVGTPNVALGFGRDIGWAHTVNVYDGADLYELRLEENGYIFDGERHPFETDTVMLKVLQSAGNYRVLPILRKRSLHGPVVGESGNTALALRIAGEDRSGLFAQYHRMIHSRDRVSFEAALAGLQIPMFNVIYADRHGEILYVFNGLVPKRATGDWDTWQQILPGDTSLYLWHECHDYEDLPRLANPETGWLQNANDPPWFPTYPSPLNPDTFPAYMSGRGMALRPQMSASLLMDDSSVSFEEMVAYKHSTRSLMADRILDELETADLSEAGEDILAAMEILGEWDHTTDAGSRGAVLFQAWARAMGNGLFDIPWDPSHPLTTPDGLKNPQEALETLGRVYLQLEQTTGDAGISWGEMNRLRMGDKDLPGNGGPGSLGIFRVMNWVPGGDGTFRQYHGDGFVAAVEFGKKTRAEAALYYGNSSRPGSPHYADQLDLFSDKKLRPALLTRKEVKAQLERTVILE